MKNEKLVKYRKMLNATQLEMATVIGVKTAQGYCYKENGKVNFTDDEKKAIQEMFNTRLNLNLTVEELFS